MTEPSLREALIELLDAVDTLHETQSRIVVDPHAVAHARAALSASPAEPQEATEAIPNWKLVHAVRSGALNALRHAGVSEELFAVVASATYAPIRAATRSAASGGDTV